MQLYFQLKLLVLWVIIELMNIFVFLRAITSEDGMTADFLILIKNLCKLYQIKLLIILKGLIELFMILPQNHQALLN